MGTSLPNLSSSPQELLSNNSWKRSKLSFWAVAADTGGALGASEDPATDTSEVGFTPKKE